MLEWVAISFPRASSQPRDRTQVFCLAGGFFTNCATWEVLLKITPAIIMVCFMHRASFYSTSTSFSFFYFFFI